MRPSATTVITRPGGGTTAIEIVGRGPAVVLAPGAGAGRDHPFMTGMRDRLVAHGFRVASFDYPYREAGRSAPDRLERLIACHLAVANHTTEACGQVPFLIGKSMGGRVGSHLAIDAPGWGFLGYPLVAAGRTEPRDVSHLASIGPTLFVQGSRDALAPPPLISAVVAGLPHAELEVITDADHGFRVPKRSGLDADAVLDRIAGRVAGWMRRVAVDA